MVYEKFQTENNKWWLSLALLSSKEKCYLLMFSSLGVLGVASRKKTDEGGLTQVCSWDTVDRTKF